MDKAEFSSNSEENNTEWTEAMADVEEMSNETADKKEGERNVEELFDRAKLYRQFGQVALALTNLDEALLASQNETIMGGVLLRASSLLRKLLRLRRVNRRTP